jgi:hypothetical protein
MKEDLKERVKVWKPEEKKDDKKAPGKEIGNRYALMSKIAGATSKSSREFHE